MNKSNIKKDLYYEKTNFRYKEALGRKNTERRDTTRYTKANKCFTVLTVNSLGPMRGSLSSSC